MHLSNMLNQVCRHDSLDLLSISLTSSVGPAYIMNVVAWVFSLITSAAIVYTGISAQKGRKWAAGNRAYRPISG